MRTGAHLSYTVGSTSWLFNSRFLRRLEISHSWHIHCEYELFIFLFVLILAENKKLASLCGAELVPTHPWCSKPRLQSNKHIIQQLQQLYHKNEEVNDKDINVWLSVFLLLSARS